MKLDLIDVGYHFFFFVPIVCTSTGDRSHPVPRFVDRRSVTVERVRRLLNKSSRHNDGSNLLVERVIWFNVHAWTHTCSLDVLAFGCSLPFVRPSLSSARARNLAVLPFVRANVLGVDSNDLKSLHYHEPLFQLTYRGIFPT